MVSDINMNTQVRHPSCALMLRCSSKECIKSQNMKFVTSVNPVLLCFSSGLCFPA